MKNSPKKIPEKLQNARDAFDYIVKMSFDKVKSGGRIDSEFIAIAYMPGDDHFSIIPVPLADTIDEAQRNDVMALFAEDLAAQGADAYIFIAISEVWISERVAESSGKNKMEGLVASAHDKNGYTKNISYKIKRKSTKIEFERINLFGKSQAKQMYEWTKGSDTKIKNSLTEPAWASYKKAKKQQK